MEQWIIKSLPSRPRGDSLFNWLNTIRFYKTINANHSQIAQATYCKWFAFSRYKQSKKDYKGKEIETHKYWLNSKTNQLVQGEYYDKFIDGGTYEPVTKGFFMGFAGSLEYAVVDKEGKIVPIGWLSSLTEEIKIAVRENPEKIKNKVIESEIVQSV